jgi:glutathione synthase/RimK-type ligase-like ATP-grasp enzyme
VSPVDRRRPRVALATYDRAPELAPDDRLIPPALAALGVDATAAVWSDGSGPWEAFDAVLIRSCWDYHLRSGEFHAWLDRLDAARVPVWNSTTLVRWNADKRYLLDLAARGVPTLPTVVIPRGVPDSVARTATERGWTRFVLKPAVSASGYETHAFQLPLAAADRAAIERVSAAGAALLQPFADEIPAIGELSFVFLGGQPSHAALKRAAAGEFRVQTEHGGSVEPIVADPTLVEQAAAALAALDETPLYARVDGVLIDERFVLMELELIEPNLFLALDRDAPARLATAIARRLGVDGSRRGSA